MGGGSTSSRLHEQLDKPLDLDELGRDIESLPKPMSFGFGDALDKYGGITPGALTLISGRYKSGKTNLMLNIANHLLEHERPVWFFTYEEPCWQLAAKLLRINAGSAGAFTDNYHRSAIAFLEVYRSKTDLESGDKALEIARHIDARASLDLVASEDGTLKQASLTDLNEQGLKRLLALSASWKKLHNQGLCIIDAYFSVEDLIKQISLAMSDAHGGIKVGNRRPVIFIDYLQIIPRAKSSNDLFVDVQFITKQLNKLANQLNLPIVLGCQLNQKGNFRSAEDPGMAANIVLEIEQPENMRSNKVRNLKVPYNRYGEKMEPTRFEFDWPTLRLNKAVKEGIKQ